MTTPITKPGKHGTLHLYILRYTDRYDEGCPIFESNCWIAPCVGSHHETAEERALARVFGGERS